ncbi:MAG: O-antigen ligase family protein [Flavobacteriales bacterium]
MTRAQGEHWALGVTGVYLAALAVGMWMDFPWLAALPLVLLIAAWAFVRTEWLLALLVFCVPLSFNLEALDLGGIGLYLPTEPLLAGLLVLFLARAMMGWPVSEKLLRHPVSKWIGIMLMWLAFTSSISTLPLVSFKFLAARSWFVVGFFYLIGHVFVQRRQAMEQFVFLYTIPLVLVIIYTIIRHAGYGFDKDAGHWVMWPFFKDHTSYGAVLAMWVPVVIALLWDDTRSVLHRLLSGALLSILVLGTILSFTRAAWVSLAGAGVLWVLMKVGIRLKTLLVIGFVGLAFLFLAQDALLITLQRNEQDSSDDLAEHVESISNVSSDASNLERLNRWNCALAMFAERPWTGWGPGTYQFLYAPFQRSEDHTIISTNNADGGNAHSEYLGPMAEQGLPGVLIVLILLGWTLHLGFKLQRQLIHPRDKRLAMGAFLGLMTYFVHGVLNNYLDTDKASAPFWGLLVILVALDLHRPHSPGTAPSPSA